jgi:hypothetical protein
LSKNKFGKNRLGAKWTFHHEKEASELYQGSFWLNTGEELWEGKGIIDSATDLTIVKGDKEGADFSDKNSTAYNAFNIWPNFDKNSNKYSIEPKEKTVEYGNSKVKGQWAKGEIFLNQNGDGLESNDFEFLYATESDKVFAETQGIFGMARPGKSIMLNPSATPENGRKLFLDSWDYAMTNDKTFSTRFSSDHFSWIDMGSLNSVADNKTEFDMIKMNDDFFWSSGMNAVRFGSNDANMAVFEKNEQMVSS